MSGAKTPLQVVNEQHGGKEKLVDKLVGLIERGEAGADELKERLRTVSNQKLLRLLAVNQELKDKYGSKEKLTQAVASALGRAKDADYVRKLGEASVGKLLDMARSLAHRAKGAIAPEAKGAAKAKKAAAPKAEAKAAPAKKAAAKKPAAKAEKPAKSKK